MLWLTKGVSIRLLARTAGRTWVRCCSGRTGKARALLGPLAVRTYRTWAKALSGPKPCGRADKSEGFVGSKAVQTSGQERRLCRVKAVRSSGQERRLCRVKAVRSSGQERRLCRVKAVRSSGQERRLCRVKAVRSSGQARRPRLRWALS